MPTGRADRLRGCRADDLDLPVPLGEPTPEFPDPEVRRVELEKLRGIEDRCFVQVAGHERLLAVADEDLERENETKTSAVHFLRFELTDAMVAHLKTGAALAIGVDHPNYRHTLGAVPQNVQAALTADFD